MRLVAQQKLLYAFLNRETLFLKVFSVFFRPQRRFIA